MADQKQETTNFNRSLKVLIDLGTKTLRDVVKEVLLPDTLDGVVKANITRITELYRQRVLFDKQYDLLIEDPPDPEKFDISLLAFILRNLCNAPAPSNGWSKEPDPTDNSLGADIVRLRDMRNTIYAHVPNTRVTNTEFEKIWTDLKAVIVSLSKHGSTSLQNISESIDAVKSEDLDPHNTEMAVMLEALRNWQQQDEKFEEILKKLNKLEVLQKESVGTQHEIKDTQQELVGTQHEIKDTQQEIVGTEHVIKDTQQEIVGTQHEIKDTQQEIVGAQHMIKDTQQEIVGTQHEIKDTQQEIVGTQHGIKDTQQDIVGTQNEIKDTQQESLFLLKDIHTAVTEKKSKESSSANQTEVADRELSSATNNSSMSQSSSRTSLESDSLQNSFSAFRTSDKDDQTYFDNKTDDADELESDEESLDEKWESHSTKATPELPTLTHKHSSGAKTKLKFGPGVSIQNLQIGDNNTMFIGGPSGDQRVPKTKSKSKKSRGNVKLTESMEPVTPDTMDKVCSEIGQVWRRFCRKMGFSEGECEQFRQDFHVSGVYEITYQAMRRWTQEKPGEATKKNLAAMLHELDRDDLATRI